MSHDMTAEERQNQQQEQEKRLKKNMSQIKNKILVMSGKGGVGKTSVSVNLAFGLAAKGFKVGLLDTDVHGPNIAKMLGIEGEQLYSTDDGVELPQVNENLKAASIALAGNDQDAPIVWRGPLKMGFIKQFLSDLNWGELDYLIIDSPPGTGDEPLSVCQLIPELTGAIIVTTPQDVAILDSRKSVNFARQVGVPLLGIVENMSGFICPDCGTVHNIFGTGGGEKAAEDMNARFLGRIPFETEMMEYADRGESFISRSNLTPGGKALMAVIDGVLEQIK